MNASEQQVLSRASRSPRPAVSSAVARTRGSSRWTFCKGHRGAWSTDRC